MCIFQARVTSTGEASGRSSRSLRDRASTNCSIRSTRPARGFSARALPINLAGESQTKFIDFVYEPVRDDEGTVTGIFVGGYDITERVVAEHSLLAAEGSAAQVLDATSEAFYAVDRDGRTTLWSAAFLKMLDFKDRDAVIGRALHGVIHHSHPDGSHYAREDCPIYRAAAKGVSAHVLEELFFRADGTAFPVEYRA